MPIHFLWGDEDFLIEKATNKIKKEILGTDVNELNYRAVDNPNFSAFSELIRTNAMMFGDIVIQIKCQKYFLETKSKETTKEIDNEENTDCIHRRNHRLRNRGRTAKAQHRRRKENDHFKICGKRLSLCGEERGAV